jgi:hypothetical protein
MAKTSLYFVSEVTPVLDTNAYSQGDHMGAIFTIPSAVTEKSGAAILSGLHVLDKANNKKAFDILLFCSSPTVASADNAAIDISDAEMAKCIGMISVLAADYTTVKSAGNAIASYPKSGFPSGLICNNGDDSTNLYGLLVMRDAAGGTYGASDLVIKFSFIPE